jgi:hypothetical protein
MFNQNQTWEMADLAKQLGILSDNLHSVIAKLVESGFLSIDGAKIKVNKNLTTQPYGFFSVPSIEIMYMI